MRCAVLHLDDDAVGLAVVDVEDGRPPAVVVEEVRAVGVRNPIAVHGAVPAGLEDLLVETFRRLRALAEREGAEVLVPVVTGALPHVSDGHLVLRQLSAVAATPVRCLDAAAEARLVFAGAAATWPGEPLLLLRFDGDRLGITLGTADRVELETDLDLGVDTVLAAVAADGGLTEAGLRDTDGQVRRRLARVAGASRRLGTGRTVVAVPAGHRPALAAPPPAGSAAAEAPGAEVRVDELRTVRTRLVRQVPRLGGMRAVPDPPCPHPVVGSAAVTVGLLVAVADALGIEVYTVAPGGLREGVAVQSLHAGMPPASTTLPGGSR
jgi:exopolyphosphatase/pppGpp-phosphohydrolase